MSDLYDKIKEDVAFRRKWAERCGFGFALLSVVPNVPKNAEEVGSRGCVTIERAREKMVGPSRRFSNFGRFRGRAGPTAEIRPFELRYGRRKSMAVSAPRAQLCSDHARRAGQIWHNFHWISPPAHRYRRLPAVLYGASRVFCSSPQRSLVRVHFADRYFRLTDCFSGRLCEEPPTRNV
jgi:hypothetical protein